ncbi:cyclic nucleotide-binding domain-containing protein [Streptomyces antarcticus]|uniref:cyclic nucleotide-binding domain-containing protein n=1 Tax=Streptomyces antarcticus TaxID=2996458 RepID=UPI00226FFE64|nr:MULTISPECIES: cyclic nucleotide-binding domain-containing protein [unclassified Streptomyces]MCY0939760.1 cyclic nucleotide-binding domain-containing protein [Streptomyces sp. H34-AA3]MCZ4080930.1 cyclic nucleotide-binding domain-containing protein [Streptomyces sp. H34-S5]
MRTLLNDTAPEARESLLAHSRRVDVPGRTRAVKERWRADRFWIIENGTVDLDMHVPGHRAAVVDTLASGELLGWSWMVPPYIWHLGATATRPVRALEIDATAVRELCKENSAVGSAASIAVAAVTAQRLSSARTRILDLFAPHGSGQPLAHAR